jgi:hypothetical protein
MSWLMSVNVTSPSVPKGFTRVKGYATGTLIFSFLTALILLPGVEGRLERGVGGPRNTPGSSLGCTLGVHISGVSVTSTAVVSLEKQIHRRRASKKTASQN